MTETKLIKKEEVAENTMAFYFAKPASFEFVPGQHITLTLINPPETDDEGNSRYFSIITAPHEEHLGIATRIRDTALKRSLKNLPAGSRVKIDGPYGQFNLQKNSGRPAVFLIGGIGITPVFSILKHAAKEKLPHKIFLFYSNRRPEDAPFLRELQNLEKENPNFKLIATMTQVERSPKTWSGETGYVTKEMIRKYIPDLNSPIFYMSGPPQMVKAMRELLEKGGVDETRMKFEEFAGY
ncbi:FAD-dependent oxidoreductase [Candidatus Parcubacteria bacterium]|nr:MAG: FAD-dependent oxidoreductase [Candidatus Parcubacteria bacterium]